MVPPYLPGPAPGFCLLEAASPGCCCPGDPALSFTILNLLFLYSTPSVCVLLRWRSAPPVLWTRTPGGRTQAARFHTATPGGLSRPQDDAETDLPPAEDDEAGQEARGCGGCSCNCCGCIFSVSITNVCYTKHYMSGWDLNRSVINSKS